MNTPGGKLKKRPVWKVTWAKKVDNEIAKAGAGCMWAREEVLGGRE